MCVPYSKPFGPSLVKKRDSRRTKVTVAIKTNKIRLRNLRAELSKLTERRAWWSGPEVVSELGTDLYKTADTAGDWVDVEMEPAPTQLDAQPTTPMDTTTEVVVGHLPTRRTVPDKATTTQYEKWMSLLPKLQPFYLQQLSKTTGVPSPSQPILFSCSLPKCTGMKTAKVLCLFLDCKLLSNFGLKSNEDRF